MLNFIKIYFSIISFLFINTINANECNTDSILKIGLIENDFIDYQYYLYYELGNYSTMEGIEFNLQIVKNNVNEFDIIFGEYYELVKLSQSKVILPSEINEFYIKNNIEIQKNILPLDLDTFIIVSKEKQKGIDSLEELSNIYNPIKYTLGMSFKNPNELAKIIKYNIETLNFDIKELESEKLVSTYRKLYKNLNKNILSANYLDIFNSYENKENVYTLLGDGILLYKNYDYGSYQLLPQTKYIWDNNKGTFIKRFETIPNSFFGFSAYLNNSNQFGFLCHLLKRKVRDSSFRNFNINLSPLSTNEIQNLDQLPDGYSNILDIKNQNISEINYKNFIYEYKLIKKIIFGNENYENIIETSEYLNK